MVLIAPFIGAAVFLSGFAAALPTNSYDSSNSNSNYGGSSDSNSYGGSSSNSNYGGSSDNSNYGGSSDNSNYGGSSDNSNYGGNSGNNYGGNNYQSSSTENKYETSSTNNYNNNYQTTSEKNMYMTSSTSMVESTSTTSSYNSYSTPSYGSGSNYWGGSGYEDCVNQCIAQFGGSSGGGGGSYQATATSGSYGSKGTGATHTVIVAPTKGVFRMMPFATNASVGDTIEFHWGADQHTVTKSSALLPCNKSSDAPVFASGEQNKSFVFTQVVNDTKPTFYYCGTPTHCEKGMFGIINPQMATPGSPSSLGGMMQSMAANDSDLSAYAAYSNNVTASNNAAATWGSSFDMSSLPDWSHSLVAANVYWTRAVLGMNSEILKADNSIDLSSVSSTPLMLPMDISAPLNAAASAASASAAPTTPNDAAATPAGAAASDPAAASPSAKSNGASSVASPRLLVAGAVVLATIFAL
jgi:plastocyanin